MDRPPGADFLVHGRPGKDEAPGEIWDRGPEPVAIGEPSARRAATPIANPLYVRCRATDHLDQDSCPRLSAASEIARIARPRTTPEKPVAPTTKPGARPPRVCSAPGREPGG
jgi:hypothetical protein